jgi:hypothetical protein
MAEAVKNESVHGERAPEETVRRQSALFEAKPELCQVLDALPNVLIILNAQRQIVFANRQLRDLLGVTDLESIRGLRPGEVLDCEHVFESGGACGMSEACKTCGAAQAMAVCIGGVADEKECRILQKHTGRALDLRVSTTPFPLNGETFIVLSLTDIANEKRRQVLERVFFHDLLNIAGGIVGYADLLRLARPGESDRLAQSIKRLVWTLAEEIRAQRDLAEAEADELQLNWEQLGSRSVLLDLVEMYQHHEAARERRLVLDPATADVVFSSDRVLLGRILSNMTKNALEASPVGRTITIGCTRLESSVEFSVHNAGGMPREVQAQVFQRSFSTKGAGRGLGTYSIRLLTERYLGGEVSFTSSEEEGTTFRVRLPLHPRPSGKPPCGL